MMRSGSSKTNETIRGIVSSDECPERKRRAVVKELLP